MRKTKVPEGAKESLGMAIYMAGLKVSSMVDRAFVEAGVDTRDYCLLWILEHDGAMNQQVLSNDLKVSRNTMVSILDALVDKGFVSRTQNPNNRRENVIKITSAGKRCVEGLYARAAAVRREIDKKLSEDEQQTVLTLLWKFLD